MSKVPAVDPSERRPLYRAEYEALGRLGMFDDEKVELLDGQIVYAAEEGPPHSAVCGRLNRILIEALPASVTRHRDGVVRALHTRRWPWTSASCCGRHAAVTPLRWPAAQPCGSRGR